MPEEKKLQSKKNLLYMKTAGLAFDFGFIIVIPLLISIFLGKKINTWIGTEYATPIAIILAMFISGYFVWREITGIRKEFKDLENTESKKPVKINKDFEEDHILEIKD